jgi:hypothetical protein
MSDTAETLELIHRYVGVGEQEKGSLRPEAEEPGYLMIQRRDTADPDPFHAVVFLLARGNRQPAAVDVGGHHGIPEKMPGVAEHGPEDVRSCSPGSTPR